LILFEGVAAYKSLKTINHQWFVLWETFRGIWPDLQWSPEQKKRKKIGQLYKKIRSSPCLEKNEPLRYTEIT